MSPGEAGMGCLLAPLLQHGASTRLQVDKYKYM
jgi:hypothetical protein